MNPLSVGLHAAPTRLAWRPEFLTVWLRVLLSLALLVGSGSALMLSPKAHALEVAGVKVDEKTEVDGQALVLNGAGLRTRLVFKVYVAALYLPAKTTTAQAVLQLDGPRRLTLRLMRDLEADTLQGALVDGLKANLSAAELSTFDAPVQQLSTLMKGIGKVRETDIITLDFSPEGVRISLNGTDRGVVTAAGFAQALLKVWLGEKPAEASLKQALLGGGG